jgi:hypothetical protein
VFIGPSCYNVRASPRVCQNLLGKSCVLPTSKKLCKVKKIHLQQFVIIHLPNPDLTYCWGDSESSLSYTKNKRVSLSVQTSMRKAQQRNPRSHWFLFHLSEFVFRPVPFVASGATKRVQNNPGYQGLGQAKRFLPRRNLRSESYSPR